MLELIGFIALVYLAIKFFPDIIVFAFKTMIVLVGLWLLFGAVIWAFGVPVVLYEFRFQGLTNYQKMLYYMYS